MGGKIVRIVVWGSVAIAAVIVLYIRYTTSKVNGLIDQANALIDQGVAEKKELGSDEDQLFMGRIPPTFFVKQDGHSTASKDEFLNGAGPKGMVLDKAKLEKTVANTSKILTQVAEDYRAAAEKYDEGRRVGKSEVVTRYLELMSQAQKKRAEAEDVRRKAIALLIDKSIRSQGELYKKCGDLVQEARKLEGEFDRLEFEAHKLHDDNKGKFK